MMRPRVVGPAESTVERPNTLVREFVIPKANGDEISRNRIPAIIDVISLSVDVKGF